MCSCRALQRPVDVEPDLALVRVEHRDQMDPGVQRGTVVERGALDHVGVEVSAEPVFINHRS